MSHILIVDDDASHRALLCDALQEMGYRTSEAENGRVALDFLEKELPDAVILDLRMPVMSGWAVLDVLKRTPRTKDLPIIIMSAYGFEWEAELVGASGYVSKPGDLDALRAKVEQIVGPPKPDTIH
jgi:CheY-like chemotaxis protein